MKMRFILPALGFLLCAGICPAQDTQPLVTTLDNGLTVAIQENHQSQVVTLRLYVRAGSMYEGEYLGAGLTHLLEHLVSGGTTERRKEAESRKILDSIGAQSNAYTARDHTCFYITTASRHFDVALDLLSDWVMNCAVTDEEFQREIQVVQREMQTRESSPGVILHDLMAHTMFKAHPAQHPVIGYPEIFRRINREDVFAYYKHTYVPNNVTFVVAGDIEAQAALRAVENAFARFERRAVSPIVLPAEPPQVARREAMREFPAGQAYLLLAYRTVPLTHPDLYALDLMAFVLGRGESARLVRNLREEKSLVSGIQTWSYTPDYDGEFGITATVVPEKLDAARDAILAEVRRLQEELITPDELNRAKQQKISEYIFGLQTVETQAASLGMDILSARDPAFSRSYVQRIQETTAEEIQDAARRYLADEKLCVAVVRPPLSTQSAIPLSSASGKAGAIEKVTLDNGLRLLVKRNPSQPVVSIQAYWLGGLRGEPTDKNGLANFTAHMLLRGTDKHSIEEIARILDEMGASMTAAAGNNSCYVSAACLSKDFEKMLGLFAEVLRRPAFSEKEMERLRPLLIGKALRLDDDWHNELFRRFREKFYPAHPYRNTPIGKPADLKAICRDDIVGNYDRSCVPNNVVVAVFGDIQPEEVKKLAAQYFGDWPASKGFTPPSPIIDPPPKQDVTLREQSERRATAAHADDGQAGVFVGFSGPALSDEKDRYALDVLDAVISGIDLPRGRLHQILRGDGLVYEVHAYTFTGPDPGFFGIYAGCESSKAEEVQETILEQTRLIKQKPISSEELEAARQICISADVLHNEANSEQAASAALDELYGLGYDHGAKYAQEIMSVTAEEVMWVANKYFTHALTVLLFPARPPEK